MHDSNPELFNLAMSPEAQPLLDAVKKHIAENVDPISDEFYTAPERKRRSLGMAPQAARAARGCEAESTGSRPLEFLFAFVGSRQGPE